MNIANHSLLVNWYGTLLTLKQLSVSNNTNECIIINILATKRVDGNHKGLLTRQRQPKLAARAIKYRYEALAQGNDYHPEQIPV